MSKLYLTGMSDSRKEEFTSRGFKWIRTKLGYDEGDFSKKIRIDIEESPVNKEHFRLYISNDQSKFSMTCLVSKEQGIFSCQPITKETKEIIGEYLE